MRAAQLTTVFWLIACTVLGVASGVLGPCKPYKAKGGPTAEERAFWDAQPKYKYDRANIRPEFQHLSDEEIKQATKDWIRKGDIKLTPKDYPIIPAAD